MLAVGLVMPRRLLGDGCFTGSAIFAYSHSRLLWSPKTTSDTADFRRAVTSLGVASTFECILIDGIPRWKRSMRFVTSVPLASQSCVPRFDVRRYTFDHMNPGSNSVADGGSCSSCRFLLRELDVYGKGGKLLKANVPTMSQEASISTTSKLLLRRRVAFTHCMKIIAWMNGEVSGGFVDLASESMICWLEVALAWTCHAFENDSTLHMFIETKIQKTLSG